MKQLLSFLMLLVGITAAAQEFTYTYEGQTLNYRVLENWAKTCEVTRNSDLERVVVIPEKVLYEDSEYSVTAIGYHAFSDCWSLTSIDIPNSVTYIGYGAFEHCNYLTSIYSLNPTPPTIGYDYYYDCFDYRHFYDATLYVPQEALEAYRTAETWKEFKNIVGIGQTGVENVNVANKNTKKVYYDMNGRRLNAPIKGMNIVNGKKMMMK